MTAVVIVKRPTLNWAEIDFPTFKQESISFCQSWGRPEDYAYKLAQLWDRTFSHGYFETRHKIKLIAEQNINALDDVQVSHWNKERQVPQLDAPYVFVDDDDWFSPELPRVMRLLTADKLDIVLWRVTNIGSPNQPTPVFYWGKSGRCMTHNYAVSGRWIDQHSIEDVLDHGRAMKTIHAMENVPQLDVCLGVSNKGPISSVSLHKGLDGELEPQKLASLVAAYLNRMATISMADLAHITWAKDPVDKTIGVYQAVLDSLKI